MTYTSVKFQLQIIIVYRPAYKGSFHNIMIKLVKSAIKIALLVQVQNLINAFSALIHIFNMEIVAYRNARQSSKNY